MHDFFISKQKQNIFLRIAMYKNGIFEPVMYYDKLLMNI